MKLHFYCLSMRMLQLMYICSFPFLSTGMERDIKGVSDEIKNALSGTSNISIVLEEFGRYYWRPSSIQTEDFEVAQHVHLWSEYQPTRKQIGDPYHIFLPSKKQGLELCYWQMLGGNEQDTSDREEQKIENKISQMMLLEQVGLNVYIPKNLSKKPLQLIVHDKEAAQAIVNLLYSSPLFPLLSGKKGLMSTCVQTMKSKMHVRHMSEEQLHDFAVSEKNSFINEDKGVDKQGYFKCKGFYPSLENPKKSIRNQKKKLTECARSLNDKAPLDYQSVKNLYVALLPGSKPSVIKKAFAVSAQLMRHFAQVEHLESVCKRYSLFKNMSIGLGLLSVGQLLFLKSQKTNITVLGGTIFAGILSFGYTLYLRPKACSAQEELSSSNESEIAKPAVISFRNKWQEICKGVHL